MKEGESYCPEPAGSLSLQFVYRGDGSQDIFASKIESVHLYAFRPDGEFLRRFQVGKEQLKERQGMRLDLDPGEYRLVLWGNLNENSRIVGQNRFDEFGVVHPYPGQAGIATFDSLYFATRPLVVRASADQTETIEFRSAYYRLEVYLEGLSYPSTDGGELMPVVAVEPIHGGYDFRMRTTEPMTTAYPGVSAGKRWKFATCDLLRFGPQDMLQVNILSPRHENVLTISLPDFLADNQLDIWDKQEVVIPIYVRFTDVGVEIKVPDWDSEPIQPDF